MNNPLSIENIKRISLDRIGQLSDDTLNYIQRVIIIPLFTKLWNGVTDFKTLAHNYKVLFGENMMYNEIMEYEHAQNLNTQSRNALDFTLLLNDIAEDLLDKLFSDIFIYSQNVTNEEYNRLGEKSLGFSRIPIKSPMDIYNMFNIPENYNYNHVYTLTWPDVIRKAGIKLN